MSDERWVSVDPSEFAHERAALDFVRRLLPDSEPWRAWSNFTFIDSNGRPAEVDLLVIAPSGVHLIEIKSYPDGVLDADAGTWTWTKKGRPPRRYDNPLRLAESKAKRLKSLLQNQQAMRSGGGKRQDVWVSASIFLSSSKLTVKLDPRLKGSVFGPDATSAQRNDLDGLVKHLETTDAHRGVQVTRGLATKLIAAMDQAGVQQSERYKRAGSLKLLEAVDQGDTWVDYRATHALSKVDRRVRLHVTDLTATDDDTQRLQDAVDREFRLLGALHHPGIESPLQLEENPRGRAVVYPWDADAVRLDHWVTDHGDLDLMDRLAVFRSIAEAVAYAHEHGLSHRALAPRAVWVSDPDGKPVPRLRDWTAAARDGAGLATATKVDGTMHVDSVAQLVPEPATAYAAPELRTTDNAVGAYADVFALGCLLHLLVAGRDPAADAESLQRLLDDHGHVPLSAAMDQAPSALAEVVELATQADAGSRIESVTELLSWLDAALADLTEPAGADLLAATQGSVVDGWTVLGRIGAGASSVVLLAETPSGTLEVLKVARDHDNAERLRKEHAALSTVSHAAVIRTFGLEELGGRSVLRLEPGKIREEGGRLRSETLGARLEAEGPPTIDFLERWGLDLMDGLVALEREGVDHRDIKPENLVLVERTKNKELHLALIDFSLADSRHEDIDAGTLGYLDPFLRDRPQRRWDLHAERYAAAVVLCELVTGERPSWGAGVDPRASKLDQPEIRADGVDAAIAERVVPLLHRALHRDPAQRFDTADQMRDAWRRVFSGVDATAGHTVHEVAAAVDELDLSKVTATTPLVELGLPPRLVGAIERLGVGDAGGLAAVPGNRLTNVAGVGAQVRRELRRLVTRLKDAGLLADDSDAAEDLESLRPEELAHVSVDGLAARLVPPGSGLPATEKQALLVYLGLERGGTGTDDVWPTRIGTVAATELDDAAFIDALGRARRRWANGRPELTVVRDEVVRWLAAREGVATGAEVIDLLLSRRGSAAHDDIIRRRRSAAVVRAIVETEEALDTPRLRAVRVGSQLFLALDTTVEVDGRGRIAFQADPLVEAAVALGEVADKLVDEESVAGPETVAAALGQVELPVLPEGIVLDPSRRLALAAVASEHAAASSRRELYRRGLDGSTALVASRLALLDRHGLTPDQLRARVRARFPLAEELPAQPALTRTVTDADIGLTWAGDIERFVIASTGSPLQTQFSSAFQTRFTSMTDRDLEIDELERVLARLSSDGGFVAATVDAREVATAAQALASKLDGVVLDLDALLVGRMREVASAANAQWPVLLDADADARTGGKWKALGRLIDRAVPLLLDDVRTAGRTVVGHHLGLLARYGHLDAFDVLRDELTHADGVPHGVLRAIVLVVPDAGGSAPVVDGVSVPIVTSAQTARVPRSWLQRGAA